MDLNFTNKPQNLSDSSEKNLYKLSNDQETAIENGRMEIVNEHFHKNENVISELREKFKCHQSSFLSSNTK
ncbi:MULTISPECIES: hypothetical protein [Flavobacterium]|jgi:hypothetical protein|uniref:hypothetical protein n=1 Tax=Flavobacterium TaxID=237 RepID=UPI0023663FC5|nr:hypothetical protein [Flavobacterium sp. KACC 22758]WDF59619.1 hypothetical protein PQ462_23260 [Flavobacterium sp. KACC 22758]